MRKTAIALLASAGLALGVSGAQAAPFWVAPAIAGAAVGAAATGALAADAYTYDAYAYDAYAYHPRHRYHVRGHRGHNAFAYAPGWNDPLHYDPIQAKIDYEYAGSSE